MNMYDMLLYIDPGTGSMLFTVFLGIATTVYFLAQQLWIRLKFRISGGKAVKDTNKASYVIFSEGRKYWNVFEPIVDEFEKREIELEFLTADDNDPVLGKDYEYIKARFIGSGNKAYARLNFLNADICLATTPGIDVYQWKRSKGVKWYVHILHAAGASASGYRMFSLDHYDAVLLTGEYQIDEIRELEEKRDESPKELEVVGCTYMDVLKSRLDKEGKDEHEGKIVLLAPSWGTNSILYRYGERLIDSLVSTGYKIIIRPHPQAFTSDKDIVDKLISRFPESEKLHWDREADNFDSLNKADILISDFSSVVFDYSLIFNKPFIYAEGVFDKACYDAAWLDEEIWKIRVLPSLGIALKEEQIDDIKNVIDKVVDDSGLARGREKARKEAWANIGESAVRVTEYMLKKHDEILKAQEEAVSE